VSAPVGLVGLGAMGSPIAAALMDGGNELAVFDERPEAVAALVVSGARGCASAAEVADVAEIVLVSLPTPDAVRSVAASLSAGGAIGTYVDLSTTGATVGAEVAAMLAAAGIDCLDAPVSGGVPGARARRLSVMASGPTAVFERVRPLLATFAGAIFLVGEEPGQGQMTKLLNNLLSATAMAITSEAVAAGVRAGLDPGKLIEVINASSGRNTATSDKFPEQVLTRTFDGGFRLALMAKDVDLCVSEVRRLGAPMILGSLVQQLWLLAQAQSDEGADFTTIARMFEGWAGVTMGAADG